MNEWQQTKFIDLILKAALAMVGVYAFIFCLFRNNFIRYQVESIVTGVATLVFMVSVLLSYYSLKTHTAGNKIDRFASFLYNAGMTTLIIVGVIMVAKGE